MAMIVATMLVLMLVSLAGFVVLFAMALIEHIWMLNPHEMRRRHARSAVQRMPKLKR